MAPTFYFCHLAAMRYGGGINDTRGMGTPPYTATARYKAGRWLKPDLVPGALRFCGEMEHTRGNENPRRRGKWRAT